MEFQTEKNILKVNNSIKKYKGNLLKKIVNREFNVLYTKDIILYLLIQYKETHDEFYKSLILQINDEYIKEYKNFVYNNSFWYGHSSYLYILNKMNKYGVIKKGNFENYKRIILKQIQDINKDIFVSNHRWYDLFNGLNGNLIFLLEYNDLSIKKELCKLTDKFVMELEKLNNNQDNMFMITEKNYIDRSMKNIFEMAYIDLGVAHGLINILQILYKIYIKYKYDHAIDGMNILIDYYYCVILMYKKKLKNIEKISIDKKTHYSFNSNIYKWGNGIHTSIIYLTYYCKLIKNRKYDFFRKLIDIKGIEEIIFAEQKSFTFINGTYGYAFTYYLILKKMNILNNVEKIKYNQILDKIFSEFRFTNNYSIMDGNLSPIVCMPSYNDEIIFEILGF